MLTRKLNRTLKSQSKSKKLKTKSAPKAQTKKRIAKHAAGDPYAKRIFVRFDGADMKELVRKVAVAAELSLSRYCALAAVHAAKDGWKPKLKPEAVEDAKAS